MRYMPYKIMPFLIQFTFVLQILFFQNYLIVLKRVQEQNVKNLFTIFLDKKSKPDSER